MGANEIFDSQLTTARMPATIPCVGQKPKGGPWGCKSFTRSKGPTDALIGGCHHGDATDNVTKHRVSFVIV